ncbi:alpha-galactosidase [Lachnotalea glycerini]|uniref:Alpha-galactosidase n=1 Tax=Lachnotalea glycerini TaxID=1763509 RepID=A0A371JHI4_9FIRM|nr:alpha-galactosidase [Lachnotalea glycerini]RDY32184.1 alpha-galactosidase [Lachnotalea glycerini]
MPIQINNNIITIHTRNTTYQMAVGEFGFLLHLYYGKKIEGDMSYLVTYNDRGFSGNPYEAKENRSFSMDTLPQEYPCYGTGDYRVTGFNMKNDEGIYGCDLRYQSHCIRKGKFAIQNLPAVYAKEEEANTLEIVLEDKAAGIEVTLYYGVIESLDVITRAAKIRNIKEKSCIITKASSGCLDFMEGSFDMLHFHGRHGMERMLERTPLRAGTMSFGSIRGTSSHQHNPFFIIAEKETTEDMGCCYGISLLYSGNFKCEAELDQYNQSRIIIGLQDEMFEYELKQNETLKTPEVAYIYTADGLTNLSHKYHKLIQNHICRGIYKNQPRPILINNWEATYFDFNGKKIIDIAKQAAELGVEMLVLDDGWFGERDSDNSGLGDWFVNEKKMGGSIADVVKKINDMGMKFGIWIEPEMISEDSKLYKEHRDWVYIIPERNPVLGRNQLVLDFSRKEVVDYIFDMIANILKQTNIEYIKMDMNRSIANVYTAVAGKQNYGTILYHYVLGVYDFLERLNTRFPHILIEGCSGGGGRFDSGMLYYTPQIWCSDNTDAIDRITIQYGTSFGYPISTVGAHVSAVPNHQTGRSTNIKTRGIVAMAGTFGYELDLNTLTLEEKEIVKQQINNCKKYWNLIHNGLYYRLVNPQKQHDIGAWEFASEDKSEALLNVVTLDTHCNAYVSYIKLKGLEEKAWYYMEQDKEKVYSGSALMYGGIPIPKMSNEYQSWQVHFVKVK